MKVIVSTENNTIENDFIPIGEFDSTYWAAKFVESVLRDREEHGFCARIIVDLAEEDT